MSVNSLMRNRQGGGVDGRLAGLGFGVQLEYQLMGPRTDDHGSEGGGLQVCESRREAWLGSVSGGFTRVLLLRIRGGGRHRFEIPKDHPIRSHHNGVVRGSVQVCLGLKPSLLIRESTGLRARRRPLVRLGNQDDLNRVERFFIEQDDPGHLPHVRQTGPRAADRQRNRHEGHERHGAEI
ncbi:hypothetical protein [Singulisphaera acidiphila]|uniref:hypothetical protein n=1 Tax=Singulisphaera acidiphila TaxID=466153 RepID=UPI0003777806|nr:hypothetical protein [Singulisphaera acidiphila]